MIETLFLRIDIHNSHTCVDVARDLQDYQRAHAAKKAEEEMVIFPSHASVQPRAVVIESVYTLVAPGTQMSSGCLLACALWTANQTVAVARGLTCGNALTAVGHGPRKADNDWLHLERELVGRPLLPESALHQWTHHQLDR